MTQEKSFDEWFAAHYPRPTVLESVKWYENMRDAALKAWQASRDQRGKVSK